MFDTARDSKMLTWPYESPRRGAADAGAPVRRVRRVHRRLDARRRAVHRRARRSRSTGSARACWAAAPTTGAASRCASGRTTSGARASTASATTGRSRYDDLKPYYDQRRRAGRHLRIERRTCPTSPTASSSRRRKPRCYELLVKQAADTPEHHLHPVAAVDPHAAAQRPAGVPLLRPVQPRLRDERELLVARRCCCRRRWRRAADARHQRDGARGHGRRRRPGDRRRRTSTRRTGRENHVRARIVVLAASACESARMLLNSKSSQFPQGLANSSGTVGKYLTDTTGTGVAASSRR